MAAFSVRSWSCRWSLGNPGRIAAQPALACLACAGTALASEQAVEGKKMLLKGTPKLVVLSRDGSIDVSGSDPECDGVDSSLVLDDGTQTYAGSGGNDANCAAVLDALGVPAGPLNTNPSCFDGVGCLYAPPLGRVRCAAPATNSSAAQSQRACACP